MGWSAPTAPKHTDLGEMPGLRSLSDEERDRMNKHDPNGDGRTAIRRNLEKQHNETVENLVNVYGQLAADVGNFLDEWAESVAEEEPDDDPTNVMSVTFRSHISDRLRETGETFDIEDVMDIALRRTLTPLSFYYGVNVDSTTGKCFAVVTRADLWEEDKRLDDLNFSQYVVPDFLVNPISSRYDIVNDMTPSQVRRELRKLGFIEKLEVAGL